MKYINKKLPLVGEELRYSPMEVDGVHCFDNGTLHCNKSTLKTLLSEGWIEPIKPREWWQILDRRSWYTYGNRFETKKEAEKYAEQLNNDGSLEIIKVREVIE